MISSLHGKLIYSDTSTIVVECGGVGFKCTVGLNTVSKLPKINEEVFVYTYLSVKEDALDLYAFNSSEELDCFKLITTVSGVGPKIAIALLSEFEPSKLSLLIASGDAKSLTAANGIGIKLAQKIIFELKDKFGFVGSSVTADTKDIGNAVSHTNTAEAISALVALGFSQSDASYAVSKQDISLKTEELIKLGLKELSRKV